MKFSNSGTMSHYAVTLKTPLILYENLGYQDNKKSVRQTQKFQCLKNLMKTGENHSLYFNSNNIYILNYKASFFF